MCQVKKEMTDVVDALHQTHPRAVLTCFQVPHECVNVCVCLGTLMSSLSPAIPC